MKKKAFSLLEIVFVIVVLSVVSLISTDITRNIYMSYEEQKNFAEAEFKAKITTEIIEARLKRSIFKSVANGLNTGIANISRGNGGTVLKWIDKDIEGVRGVWDGVSFVKPAYSGFADLNKSNGTSIITSDCDLSKLDRLESAITGATPVSRALYFPYANSDGSVADRFWSGTNSRSLLKIASITSATNTIALNIKPTQIGENYYITYTASAIEYDTTNKKLFIIDSFKPWDGEDYTATGRRRNLLAENIISFEFWGESDGAIVRFRVCATAQNDGSITTCKESAAIE